MWLLNTSRAELHYFADPTVIPGGYAILSHTWGHDEQSFQAVRTTQEECAKTGQNPRDLVAPKIRECCIVAERDGMAWIWIDTCCINKESSTELSEAINSMFAWYVHSDVCYAYLQDVPAADKLHEKNSAFRKSRWHTRGWTLQELLAPSLVMFLSEEWERLGTKEDLAELLEDITDIHKDYLTKVSSLTSASISQRMAWAANRGTTRVEDEAYCLLGLFGISMPTLYGEGRRAFLRLQQEITKQSIDTTNFASGDIYGTKQHHIPPIPLQVMWDEYHGSPHDERFIFAPSPSEYYSDTVYYSPDLSDSLQPYLPDDVRGLSHSFQHTCSHPPSIRMVMANTRPEGSVVSRR